MRRVLLQCLGVVAGALLAAGGGRGVAAAEGGSNSVISRSTAPVEGYYPSVGNGFLAYDVGCADPAGDYTSGSQGLINVAGLFNGRATETPSHRASLPGVHAFALLGNGGAGGVENWTATLDMQRGVFENASSLAGAPGVGGDCAGLRFTQAWRAHRSLQNVLMYTVSVEVEDGTGFAADSTLTCTVQLRDCNDADGWDEDMRIVLAGGASTEDLGGEQPANVTVFETLLEEEPGIGNTTVALASEAVPTSMTFTLTTDSDGAVLPGDAQQNRTFIATVCTSRGDGYAQPSSEPSFSQQDYEDVAQCAMDALGAAVQMGADSLVAKHEETWNALWESGIEVWDNDTMATAINASLYAILSSVDAGVAWAISPGGLPRNSYNGHVFWDDETWVFPGLAVLQPDIAEAFVAYRVNRLAAALDRAAEAGYDGAKFPWESALTGQDCTPDPDVNTEGDHEIHVTADVPLAHKLMYQVNGNTSWFVQEAWPLLEATCQYFASRVSVVSVPVADDDYYDNGNDNVDDGFEPMYTYLNVQPPDEAAGIVNSSVYTNAAAAQTLLWGVQAATSIVPEDQVSVTQTDLDTWTEIANNMYLPLAADLWPDHIVHTEYDNYDGGPINQADVALLQYPLRIDMPDEIALNDLAYYENLTSIPGVTAGYYTGDSSYSIAYLMLGPDGEYAPEADAQYDQAFLHMDLTSFYVWQEKTDGGHLNFLTGAGGFLQNVIYGYAGLQTDDDQLRLNPQLPQHRASAMKLRAIFFQGHRFSVEWDTDTVTVELLRCADLASSCTPRNPSVTDGFNVVLNGPDAGAATLRVVQGASAIFPRQEFFIAPRK